MQYHWRLTPTHVCNYLFFLLQRLELFFSAAVRLLDDRYQFAVKAKLNRFSII